MVFSISAPSKTEERVRFCIGVYHFRTKEWPAYAFLPRASRVDVRALYDGKVREHGGGARGTRPAAARGGGRARGPARGAGGARLGRCQPGLQTSRASAHPLAVPDARRSRNLRTRVLIGLHLRAFSGGATWLSISPHETRAAGGANLGDSARRSRNLCTRACFAPGFDPAFSGGATWLGDRARPKRVHACVFLHRGFYPAFSGGWLSTSRPKSGARAQRSASEGAGCSSPASSPRGRGPSSPRSEPGACGASRAWVDAGAVCPAEHGNAGLRTTHPNAAYNACTQGFSQCFSVLKHGFRCVV